MGPSRAQLRELGAVIRRLRALDADGHFIDLVTEREASGYLTSRCVHKLRPHSPLTCFSPLPPAPPSGARLCHYSYRAYVVLLNGAGECERVPARGVRRACTALLMLPGPRLTPRRPLRAARVQICSAV
jgi:hypothetical protein